MTTTLSKKKRWLEGATTRRGFQPDDLQFGWASGFIELRTRPLLLAELKCNYKLRRRLFYMVNVVTAAAKIPDREVATHVTAVVYDHHLDLISKLFQLELETKDVRVWNQLRSALSNLRWNLEHPTAESKHRPKNPYFVLRAPIKKFRRAPEIGLVIREAA